MADLRLEPYAEMWETELPTQRIIDEFCCPKIDRFIAGLGLKWDEFFGAVHDGSLPHADALKLLAAVEALLVQPSSAADCEKLLKMLWLYRELRTFPLENISPHMQGVIAHRAPGMAGKIGKLAESECRSRLMLK